MLQISLTKLSTKKLDNLAEQTIQLSEMNANPEVRNSEALEVVKEEYGIYHEVVIKEATAGMGGDVKLSDLTRDGYHSGLNNILTGFSAFPKTKKGKAAGELIKVFTETGSITKLGYVEETTVLGKLAEKLELPENRALITLLGIEDEVGDFMAAHSDFKQIYTEQVDANSSLRQQPSASSIRRDLESALRSFYSHISNKRTKDGWKDIYSDLDELLKKM